MMMSGEATDEPSEAFGSLRSRYPWRTHTVAEKRAVKRLRWRIVAGLLIVSAVPFVAVGSGGWIVFQKLAIERTLAAHRTMARAHATAIDMYLTEKLRVLEMIATVNGLAELSKTGRLQEVFAGLSAVHHSSFVDVGIIDERGNHLAYVGPFDLIHRTYADAEWFQAVMAQGVIVSDVFLGHRQIPHSVVAVRQRSPEGYWILRATLDNRTLYALVRSLEVGTNGDVFIVNRQGLYQTPPNDGAVLNPARVVDPTVHPGVRDRKLPGPTLTMRQATTWLNGDRWMLVVQQPESEILAPVYRAVVIGAVIAAVALVLVLAVIVLTTSHLTRRVELANQERDEMYADVLRSAKLASLGELSAGLAHEINTPLATISAEHTNLWDTVGGLGLSGDVLASIGRSIERCNRQIARCANITGKMLQFGRTTDTTLRATDVESVLRDFGVLLEHRARAEGAFLTFEVESALPPTWLDANELEQVIVNLVNNSIDAVEQGGKIIVSARSEVDHVIISVADDGSGIAPDALDRVFQPFFTTKPVGQGTGLGLSVVHGIVRGWGGSVDVESAVGEGTRVTIRVPLASKVLENTVAEHASHERRVRIVG